MIDDIKKNLDREILLAKEILGYSEKAGLSVGEEKKILQEAMDSLGEKIRILNDSLPSLLNQVSIVQKLPVKNEDTGLTRVSYSRGDPVDVIMKTKDKNKYLKELEISESLIKKIKKARKPVKVENTIEAQFRSPRGYLKYSNRFFLNWAINLANKGYFRALAPELRKANFDILFPSYLAMMFFTMTIAFFLGLLAMIILMFVNIGLVSPFISAYSGSYLARLLEIFWIPIVLPVIAFGALYIYPRTERGSREKKINQELPFAVVHMSAISGSGIEPAKIFQIIGLSKEYPYLGKEIRKVLNQINIYGYDLVTALTNVSKTTSSTKLSELFAGLSTTISSGGDLTEFFEKRSETLLLDYRLEREKFSKIAEAFMDIYISVVIATPMILLLLIIMISISGFSFGLSPDQMTFLIILVVGIINIVFMGVLQIKQPTY